MAVVRTVLIIDDNKEDREMISGFLNGDYNIIEPEDSKDAIRVLDANAGIIAAVILDITSDVKSGYGFLHIMKKRKNLSKIPVIITAVTDNDELEINALSMGAGDFIYKPYNLVVLQKRLDNIIKLSENASMAKYLQKDRLTGVYSEEIFCKKVSYMLLENSGLEYCIVYSDMENFGLLKDLFGENAGNNILIYMARVFKHFIGGDELCGRMEADHFILFLKYNKETLNKNLESIVKIINDFPVSMSIRLKFGVYKIDDINMPVQAMCSRAVLAADTIRGRYGQYVAYYDKKIWESSCMSRK